MAWVEQIDATRRRRWNPTLTSSMDKLDRHLCKGNMHLCCHVCRFACKSVDYVAGFGRNNLVVDCARVCKEFELR